MPTKAQEKAINSKKKQVIVTASAGAGKTTTMVDRVIRLIVEDKVPVSSVVMLTFADAAAEEMKARLASSLIERVKKAVGEEKKIIVDALDALPLLHCSTIDSFCYSLVKTHFEFLSLPPTVSLADEETAKSYRKKAMKQTLDEFAAASLYGENADPEEYYRFLTSFGREEDEALAGYIQSLYDYAEMTEDGAAYLQKAKETALAPAEEHPAIKRFVEKIKQSALAAKGEIEKLYFNPPATECRMSAQYKTILDVLTAFSKSASLREVMDKARSVKKPDKIFATERRAFPDAFSVWESVDAVYRAWIEEISLSLLTNSYEETVATIAAASKDAVTVVELTQKFKEYYEAVKAEEQALDFSDVEHAALTLLTNDKTVASEIGCKHLMMDESQDLNRLQERLMRAIVGEGDLFIVGDVKQSIFRFRHADPELFGERVKKGGADENAEVISFDANFRSSDAVIDFVNLVFGNLMTEEFGGVDYPKANRDGKTDGSGFVTCFFYPKKDGSEEKDPLLQKVYSVREAAGEARKKDNEYKEAVWVRDRILELVRPGHKTVLRNTKDNAEFTLSYKDIAILSQVGMKQNTVQEKVIECLREAGIPVNVGGFVRDSENADVASIVDFLRLLVSPNDDYALLSVLRSDMFSFTVEQLAEIALRGEGETFAERAGKAAETDAKLEEVFEFIEKYRFLSSSLSLYELVSSLVEERLRSTVLGRTDGRAVMGQILSFVETLKTGKASDSISEYIDYFDNYYKMELEGEIAERDAVNVMTMHKSKGLQFPVVFVIGLGREIVNRAEYQTVVRMDRDFGVCRKGSGEGKDLLFELFTQKKVKELKEDCLRLLYVAFTRAENYLFLSGSVPKDKDLAAEEISPQALKTKKEKALCCSQLVIAGLNGHKEYVTDYDSAAVVDVDAPIFVEEKTDEDAVKRSADLLRAALSYRYPHENATKTGIKFTVTAINAMKDGCLPATKFFPEEEVVKGTAYHAVMENMPFTLQSEEEAGAMLAKFASEGLITAEEAADISVKRLFIGVKKVAELVGDKAIYREKSFILHLPASEAGVADIEDEVEVQGKIDLLAIGKEDAVIVDYKLSAHTREELIETYRAQLTLYALAVQKSFGVTRIRKYIFVLGRNEVIEL